VSPKALLEGNLEILNLFDLLGSLTQSKTTGQLKLDFGLESGYIYLEQGNVIHASFRPENSEEALVNLFSQAQTNPKTRFELTRQALPNPTIHRPTQQLLFDVAMRLDHRLRNDET
jgi:hypothetical protein